MSREIAWLILLMIYVTSERKCVLVVKCESLMPSTINMPLIGNKKLSDSTVNHDSTALMMLSRQ